MCEKTRRPGVTLWRILSRFCALTRSVRRCWNVWKVFNARWSYRFQLDSISVVVRFGLDWSEMWWFKPFGAICIEFFSWFNAKLRFHLGEIGCLEFDKKNWHMSTEEWKIINRNVSGPIFTCLYLPPPKKEFNLSGSHQSWSCSRLSGEVLQGHRGSLFFRKPLRTMLSTVSLHGVLMLCQLFTEVQVMEHSTFDCDFHVPWW